MWPNQTRSNKLNQGTVSQNKFVIINTGINIQSAPELSKDALLASLLRLFKRNDIFKLC